MERNVTADLFRTLAAVELMPHRFRAALFRQGGVCVDDAALLWVIESPAVVSRANPVDRALPSAARHFTSAVGEAKMLVAELADLTDGGKVKSSPTFT